MTTQTLIEDYLERLRAASWQLPPDRQAELVGGIREHIGDAQAAGATSEVEILSLLDRLGSPEEIAQSAASEDGLSPSAQYPVMVARRSMAREIWAVLLLTIGGLVVPVIGWFAGVALLWTSNRWTLKDKLLGTLVVPGGMGSIIFFGFAAGGTSSTISTTCFSPPFTNGAPSPDQVPQCVQVGASPADASAGYITFAVVAAGLLLPPLVGLLLYRRARRRADAEPAYRSAV